ncbi:hypothetical protein VP01_814g1 [Puccinia sorghi]|uniref:Uncharacterized protein n=1 Tax=Puccinia sorghi TaxID=27349 RepID=A0A0L6UA47_9BASI|nr:hypothetical protein VP01_814g1 [Puccinia sorghi]
MSLTSSFWSPHHPLSHEVVDTLYTLNIIISSLSYTIWPSSFFFSSIPHQLHISKNHLYIHDFFSALSFISTLYIFIICFSLRKHLIHLFNLIFFFPHCVLKKLDISPFNANFFSTKKNLLDMFALCDTTVNKSKVVEGSAWVDMGKEGLVKCVAGPRDLVSFSSGVDKQLFKGPEVHDYYQYIYIYSIISSGFSDLGATFCDVIMGADFVKMFIISFKDFHSITDSVFAIMDGQHCLSHRHRPYVKQLIIPLAFILHFHSSTKATKNTTIPPQQLIAYILDLNPIISIGPKPCIHAARKECDVLIPAHNTMSAYLMPRKVPSSYRRRKRVQ